MLFDRAFQDAPGRVKPFPGENVGIFSFWFKLLNQLRELFLCSNTYNLWKDFHPACKLSANDRQMSFLRCNFPAKSSKIIRIGILVRGFEAGYVNDIVQPQQHCSHLMRKPHGSPESLPASHNAFGRVAEFHVLRYPAQVSVAGLLKNR